MKEIRYAPWFRVFTIFGVLVFWGMAFIGWMAYRQEGAVFGLAAAGVALGIGAYLLFALATSPQWVRFEQHALVVQRWIGRQRIAYESITAVSPAYTHITITTQDGKVRLHKLFANDDARLINALETHIPALQQHRAARLSATFPIVVTVKPTAPILSGIVGLALAGFGAFTLWYAITGPDPMDAFQRWVMPIMGLLSLFFGGLFLYLLLWNYPRRTVFTAAQMRQHFLLRTAVQPMQSIIAFEPGHEVRKVRGVPRQVHHIVFRYDDGRSYKWVPGEFSFPVDYIDAYEAGRVAELTEQLRRAYLALPQAASTHKVESSWGVAYLRCKLTTEKYDLIVAVEDYGEHHAGAETIHFVASRPLYGLSRFRTTNGHAALNDNGRFLLIQDPNLLLLFDLASGEAFHRTISGTHLFLPAEFTPDDLIVRTMNRVNHNRSAEPPLPPEQAASTWQRGLGPAADNGDLPSAYPGRATTRPQEERPSSPETTAAAAQAIIERAKALPYDTYMIEFETLRDELNRLDPTAQATVLTAAREHGDHDIIDLLVTVLADNAYPPAMPMFVQWLDHPNDEVRFAAAIALDMVANGRFGIESMIEGGWVQHDQIRAVVPAMRAWWQEEGKEAVPTTAQWLAQQEAKRQ